MFYQNQISLVEQKKQQWAKEKDEMSRLNDMFAQTTRKYEKSCIKTYYSNSEQSKQKISRSQYYKPEDKHRYSKYPVNDYEENRTIRSPSLPPISRESNNRTNHSSTEEDTSGYITDSPNQSSPEIWKNEKRSRPRSRPKSRQNRQRQYYEQQNERNLYEKEIIKRTHENKQNVNFHQMSRGQGHKMSTDSFDTGHETDFSLRKSIGTPSSISSNISRDLSNYSSLSQSYDMGRLNKSKEERAKWGDRGVTVGHFYDPLSSKDVVKSGPEWLEKGLKDCDEESVRSTSYIRGQNVPIDPSILAEREIKRRNAMELQDAIKEQLREREKARKWELEKKLLEERLGEERLKRQFEAEKIRLAKEENQRQKKAEMEKQRAEVMRIALEKAENEAKLNRERKRRERMIILNEEKDENLIIEKTDEKTEIKIEEESPKEILPEIPKTPKIIQQEDDGESILIGTPIYLKKKNLKNYKNRKSTKSSEEIETETEEDHQPIPIIDKNNNITNKSNAKDLDGIALLLQSISPIIPLPYANDFLTLTNSFGNLHLALLLAQQQQQHQINQQINSMSESFLPKEEPIKSEEVINPPQIVISKVDVSTLTSDDDLETNNFLEILSPPKYQTLAIAPSTSEIGIQTDEETSCNHHHHHHHHHLYLNEYSSVTTTSSVTQSKRELNGVNKENADPKELTTTTTTTTTTTIRSKSKENKKSQKERPKWGVNRPLMQYIKASDRDPFYLRNKRKIKRKVLDTSTSDSQSISSFNLQSNDERRNECTEILPIRTDSNGKMYLNFREASIVLKDVEVDKRNRQKYRPEVDTETCESDLESRCSFK